MQRLKGQRIPTKGHLIPTKGQSFPTTKKSFYYKGQKIPTWENNS